MIWYSDCNGSSASYECRRPWLCVYIHHRRRGDEEEEEELVCVVCCIIEGRWPRRRLHSQYKLKQVRLVICFFIITIITYLCNNINITILGCRFRLIRCNSSTQHRNIRVSEKNNTTLIDHCDWFNIQLHLTMRVCVCEYLSISNILRSKQWCW